VTQEFVLSTQGCHQNCDMDQNFHVLAQLGSGAFGTVHLVHDKSANEYVALKIMKFEEPESGIPGWAIREVCLLQNLEHTNIVKLLRVHMDADLGQIALTYQLVDMDVKEYVKLVGPLVGPRLANSVRQCLEALNYCHRRCVIHRDLKPQNLLINTGARQIKIADFGMARKINLRNGPYTREVVTLWYRGPELLLGARMYEASVDIWSLGCIAFEIATGAPLFPGDSEIGTLFKIFELLGTPTEESWPGVRQLPYFSESFPKWEFSNFSVLCKKYPTLPNGFMDLVKSMLNKMPRSRPSAKQLLRHMDFHDFKCELNAVVQRIFGGKSKPTVVLASVQDGDVDTVFSSRLMEFLGVQATL